MTPLLLSYSGTIICQPVTISSLFSADKYSFRADEKADNMSFQSNPVFMLDNMVMDTLFYL
jgi:hypothetical protein